MPSKISQSGLRIRWHGTYKIRMYPSEWSIFPKLKFSKQKRVLIPRYGTAMSSPYLPPASPWFSPQTCHQETVERKFLRSLIKNIKRQPWNFWSSLSVGNLFLLNYFRRFPTDFWLTFCPRNFKNKLLTFTLITDINFIHEAFFNISRHYN